MKYALPIVAGGLVQRARLPVLLVNQDQVF